MEVDDYVIPILYEIIAIVEVKYELTVPNHLVFAPLRKLLGKGYCKVSLVKPHSHSRIRDYAICVEVYSI